MWKASVEGKQKGYQFPVGGGGVLQGILGGGAATLILFQTKKSNFSQIMSPLLGLERQQNGFHTLP